jgi:hypothetical protein
LFDTKDDLLIAMRRLQSDHAYRRALGAAGRDAFSRRWTASAVVPAYLDLVAQAIRHRDVRIGRSPREVAQPPVPGR